MEEQQLLMTVGEASKRLALGRSMTWRLIQLGDLPSVKIGGARRVLVSDLEAFVQRIKEEQHDAA
jgi:excisionase family DNA binding protein